MNHITFGRKTAVDDRDMKFTISALNAGVSLPVGKLRKNHQYWWANGWWGNQGYYPHCVAYAWLHWLEDGPTTQNPTKPGADPVQRPLDLYNQCQAVDEWPGNNYDGTSVRAGAKILHQLGYIESYHWAWDLNTLIDTVLMRAPVVVGTSWYDGMMSPDDEYILRVNGRLQGGHAYLVNGVNIKKELFRIKNSWGRSWGRQGAAYITFDDMERLIREDGEICLAREIKK